MKEEKTVKIEQNGGLGIKTLIITGIWERFSNDYLSVTMTRENIEKMYQSVNCHATNKTNKCSRCLRCTTYWAPFSYEGKNTFLVDIKRLTNKDVESLELREIEKFQIELTKEEMVILGVHTQFPFVAKEFPNIQIPRDFNHNNIKDLAEHYAKINCELPVVEIITSIHEKIQKELVK